MRFQKPTSLLLAFFLFVSNIGLSMNVHYCGDEIASISLNAPSNLNDVEEDCCGIFENLSHCCSNKVVYLEKKTDHATAFTFQIDAFCNISQKEWQPIVSSSTSDNKGSCNSKYAFQSNAPPLFKLYSQYIFYDRF